MANIMIRKGETGELVFYLPKKDLEESILSLEFNSPERWGGELKLADGQCYYIEPLDAEPKLPISVRAKRM
jgi:nitrogen fixation protein NifT